MKPPYLPQSFYHVYNHANGSDNLFVNPGNYQYFLRKYAQYVHPVAETFAYCLMPNHFHLLIRVREEAQLLDFYRARFFEKLKKKYEVSILQGFQTLGELEADSNQVLSKQFADFLNGYTQAFNKQQGRKGSLFRPNTRRKLVASDAYFSQLVLYIHYNPVHHGFVKNLEDWPFSSFHALMGNQMTKLSREEVTRWFGDKKAFKAFHQSSIDKQFDLEMEI